MRRRGPYERSPRSKAPSTVRHQAIVRHHRTRDDGTQSRRQRGSIATDSAGFQLPTGFDNPLWSPDKALRQHFVSARKVRTTTGLAHRQRGPAAARQIRAAAVSEWSSWDTHRPPHALRRGLAASSVGRGHCRVVTPMATRHGEAEVAASGGRRRRIPMVAATAATGHGPSAAISLASIPSLSVRARLSLALAGRFVFRTRP